MPKGIYKHYPHKGTFKKGVKQGPHTEEWKKNFSLKMKEMYADGRMKSWNKGKKCPKHSETMKGRKVSEETKVKMSLAHLKEKSYLWKGGITCGIRKRCSRRWWKELRKIIYQRDNWTCQKCF